MLHDVLSLSTAKCTVSPAIEPVAYAFRLAGATSPATARPLHQTAGLDLSTAIAHATRGAVRESVPGRVHVYTGTEHERRDRLVTGVLVGVAGGAATIRLPLAAWLLTR